MTVKIVCDVPNCDNSYECGHEIKGHDDETLHICHSHFRMLFGPDMIPTPLLKVPLVKVDSIEGVITYGS